MLFRVILTTKILSGYTIDSHNQAVAVATKEGKQEPGPSKVVFLGTSPHEQGLTTSR